MVNMLAMKACVLFLVATVIACAEHVAVDRRFPELNLKNGSVLAPVKILSYDPDLGSVNVVAGKFLTKVDTKQLPDEVIRQLESLKPKRTEAEKIKLQQRSADAELAAQKRAAQREENAHTEYQATRAAQLALDVSLKGSEKDREAAIEDQVAKAAETYARSYFKYQNDPHSSVGYVLDSDFQMNDPEQVPGWTGRWRVSGTAGVAYATNTGGSLGRKVRDFEILLETSPKGRLKVIELRVK